jgi:polysaccharide export outer membrane protein
MWFSSGTRVAIACAIALLAAPAAMALTDESAKGPLPARELPGERVQQSFRRGLATPSPEERWRGLPVFGRELFSGRDSLALSPVLNGPVGPDYVLGPGDNLVVFISGFSDTSYSLTLDREGQVFLPRVGSTYLWGLAFADGERLIRSRLSTVLRNARVQVSMGRMRALEVFVLGSVRMPGKYTLSGMATAFNALIAAGGPGSMGSLRDVRVMRAQHEIARLDLYPFLIAGDRQNDVRLQNGDVVFVGMVRSRIGIQGEVLRPGVYEGDGPLTLAQLFELAGGPAPTADLSRVRVERVDAHGGFRLQDVPLNHGRGVDPDSLSLSDYDLVTVLPLQERMRNLVMLDGYVRHPGEYQLVPEMHLSELLRSERLLPEADLEHAEFRRVNLQTFRVEVRSFSVREVWTGKLDWSLQPMDAITIFSSARPPWTVKLEGEVGRPGTYTVTPGERLSAVLRRAGGVTPRGSLAAAVFRRLSAERGERAFQREARDRQRVELARQQAVMAAAGDTAAAAALGRAQFDLMAGLEGRTEPGRVVLSLDPSRRWEGTEKDPVLEDGDHLVVPVRPATVTVLGNVKNPGSLIGKSHGRAGDYLRRAGGADRNADLSKSYILRANGEAVPFRAGARMDPGDALVVVPRATAPGLSRSIASGSRFLLELTAAAGLIFAALR